MSEQKYFGTDGVRGLVGKTPMTVDFALRLANAAAVVLTPNGGKVLIGKDTRLSGYMFESAIEAGLVAAGVDVMLIGPLPTPGVAYMTRHLGCDFGVVVSASHNHYLDNGIKFFDRNGGKLSDELELKIEAHLEEAPVTVESEKLGKVTRVDHTRDAYQKFCLSTVPEDFRLDGMSIVVDAANGAGYKVAPRVFTELGAEVTPIGAAPNGRNINAQCGSTHPELLQLTVKGVHAHCGIALDGDGDRLLMVDENSDIIDGDQLLYILAQSMKKSGTLTGPVIGTLMTNLGVERAIKNLGIEFRRAKVGDRYIRRLMRESGSNLGGESSGHIICLTKTTTGDAIVVALQILAEMKKNSSTLSALRREVKLFPRVLINERTERNGGSLTSKRLVDAITLSEKELGSEGRVVVRKSGTEPVIRVMVEAAVEADAKRHAEALSSIVREEHSAS